MSVSLIILDGVVATLLIVTIGYAMVLNRKITGLRRDRAALERLAATFTESTARAGTHLAELHKTASTLQSKIETATTLRDDLAFLVDRGTTAADKLESAVRHSREGSAVDLRDFGAGQKKGAVGESTAADVHDIQAAKRHSARPQPVKANSPTRVQAPAREAMAQRSAGGEPAGLNPRSQTAGMEPRSEAERDLLRALRAAR